LPRGESAGRMALNGRRTVARGPWSPVHSGAVRRAAASPGSRVQAPWAVTLLISPEIRAVVKLERAIRDRVKPVVRPVSQSKKSARGETNA